ncbi:MAG TPA: FRG domain-containing protein [Thermoanaerobaculia bacterium]|jgi:hypothetical protein|nr:FRG domain-containing protein [Thermoanaerobaculia bacterium]
MPTTLQPQWKETRVTDWDGLLTALHGPAMIPVQKGQGGHFRSPYVFRGMSNSSWPLQTSLERLGSPPDQVEPPLLRSFRKYAQRGSFAEDSDWEALSVAQHNGLPTRLLDWSVSPLIAAHFATAERKYFECDGVIWCVDVTALRDRILPPAVSDPLRSALAVVYDVRLLSETFPHLGDLDAVTGGACVFFEPPSIDSRIASQFGILSAMSGPGLSHDRYFREKSALFPGLVHRIVIAASAKSQIRDMLDQNNINERMLFPGLPGLCDWLRRYYGPT